MTTTVFRRDLLGDSFVRRLKRQRPTSVLLLCDRRASRARTAVLRSLKKSELPFVVIDWLPSENKKNIENAERIARRFVRAGADRGSLLLAVGGGVTTDLGGFIASMLLRGVAWGAIPTTLLGMVDAAHGGKTGVNLQEGKNLLGSFHRPSFVLVDRDTLAGLPDREWACGMAELVKAALVGDASLFRQLESAPVRPYFRSSEQLDRAVRRAARAKLRIVEQDPEERGGDRVLLNLGHTWGHALETTTNWALSHGEAVGLGLLCAARFAEQLGLATPPRGAAPLSHRLEATLARFGLPVVPPRPLPRANILHTALYRDKKRAGGLLRLVLPLCPGRCVTYDLESQGTRALWPPSWL